MEVYNFEPFADSEEYKKVNSDIVRWWIDELGLVCDLSAIEGLLDVATGTGLMAELFVKDLKGRLEDDCSKLNSVYLLDMSIDALEISRDNLKDLFDVLVCFCMPIEKMFNPFKKIDLCLWGNGIHYLNSQSQKESLQRIRSSLSAGGWLLFNTAFYEGSIIDWTRDFYASKVAGAVKGLSGKGIQRDRSAKSRMEFFSVGHYMEMLAEVGFREVRTKEFTIPIYQSAMEHISSFSHYAAGALRGYPVEEAAAALKDAVDKAMEKYGRADKEGRKYVDRNWLAVMARA